MTDKPDVDRKALMHALATGVLRAVDDNDAAWCDTKGCIVHDYGTWCVRYGRVSGMHVPPTCPGPHVPLYSGPHQPTVGYQPLQDGDGS